MRSSDWSSDVCSADLYAVHLGDRHRAPADLEQVEDREMFARLRHDAVVRRDHQQAEVDPRDAGQHVAHETLVTRHVDEADDAAVAQRPIRSEEHTSELQSLMRITYAVFCLNKKRTVLH